MRQINPTPKQQAEADERAREAVRQGLGDEWMGMYKKQKLADDLRFGLERPPRKRLKELQKEYLEAVPRPSSIIYPPEEKPKMDGATKAVIWLIVFVLLMCSGIFTLGVWSFIEIIQWITSK